MRRTHYRPGEDVRSTRRSWRSSMGSRCTCRQVPWRCGGMGVCLIPWGKYGKWGFKPWNIRGFSQHFQTKPEIPTGNLTVYYIENGHLVRWFTLIYLLKMVIFHSYGSLPEGAQNSPILNGRMINHWILRYPIFSQTHAEARGFYWFLGIWQGLENILIKHHPTKKGI